MGQKISSNVLTVILKFIDNLLEVKICNNLVCKCSAPSLKKVFKPLESNLESLLLPYQTLEMLSKDSAKPNPNNFPLSTKLHSKR